jgi:hypothetical protein
MQKKSITRIGVTLVATALTTAIASAQGQSAPAASQQAGPAWSPAQNIGMFAFPKNGQSADQQLKDESECYGMAKQRTGIDAQAPPPQGPSEEEKRRPNRQPLQTRHRHKGDVSAERREALREAPRLARLPETPARELVPERWPEP